MKEGTGKFFPNEEMESGYQTMKGSNNQLAYVLINPYTIYKSRTGGVIVRLFTRTALNLVAARMFTPSRELAEAYAEISMSKMDPQDRKIQELIRQYILDNYSPDPTTGQRRRVMMLVFQGEDAVKKVRQTVGSIQPGKGPSGETIRDTYGDYIVGPDGVVKYFEPAVLAAPTPEEAETKLKLWAKHSVPKAAISTMWFGTRRTRRSSTPWCC